MLLAITRDDAVMRLESRHLKIEADTPEILADTVPLCHLDRVIVNERTQLSGAVVEALMSRRIPIILLSRTGDCLGIFHPSGKGDVERRRRQYRFNAQLDPHPAQRLLEAKLYNQKRVLQRLAAARHVDCVEIKEIEAVTKLLGRCRDLGGLRGVEGTAAAGYFRGLRRFLPEWCAFDGRRRPPADPFNAVLSYSYAVMAGEMENLIRLHGLDPAAGFLHCDKYNTSTLAFDLLEPLRPGFCDMLAIGLLTHRRLRPEHFAYCGRSVRMTAPGRRIFFDGWERKRAGRIRGNDGSPISWQNVWDLQVRNWLAFLAGGCDPNFFRMP